MFDEYLHVGDTTGGKCLKKFCKLVVEPFSDTYLRRPTAMIAQSLMRMHETVHGFPEMLGSIDYDQFAQFVRGESCLRQSGESARKDVERAFGVLQSRWAILKGPTRFWYKEVIADVMYACIIMHNMIVEQERGHVTDWVDDEAGSSSSTATSPVTRGLPVGFGAVLQRQASMRNQQDHTQLMTDMIEEV
ncbi:uncharacterized protein LOC125195101 [Salvia hispanica]|uniref:uncharacterized protein LOC125195101 n=1 Tax=Salvia hispanica TaxID=49212 RepID=UPI002009136E|nr:uncharacterized protein LOC125195101 [Salvia hispanica]